MAVRSPIPVALTVAGSDSSAGAGVQADLKTFSALGVYGLTAVTCVVAEMPGRVSKVEPLSAGMVSEQMDVLFKGFPVAAMKTGLLFSGEIVSAVAKTLCALPAGRMPSLVIDPVMVATSGDLLLRDNGVQASERELFPLARLITPNLDEASRLLGEPIQDLKAMRVAGAKLAEKYGVPFLLKGGHLTGQAAIDLLFLNDRVAEFSAPFLPGIMTHGTGCTYSAAITAGLASGLPLEEAVRRAKEFVTTAITKYFQWETQNGSVQALNHQPENPNLEIRNPKQ